jgi:hypothetical protein
MKSEEGSLRSLRSVGMTPPCKTISNGSHFDGAVRIGSLRSLGMTAKGESRPRNCRAVCNRFGKLRLADNLYNASFMFELLDKLGGNFLWLAGDELGLLGFLRDVDALDVLR